MNQAASPESESLIQDQRTFLQRFPWEKITIWGLFLLLVYVLRSFFTTIFLTFIFSYMMTNLVRAAHGVISPDREKVWLHRILTIASFALLIGSIYGVYSFLEKPFREQINKVVSTVKTTNLSKLGSEVIRETLGEWEFSRVYSGKEGEEKRLADFEVFKSERFNEAKLDEFKEQWQVLEENFRVYFAEKHGKERFEELQEAGELGPYLREWLLESRAEATYEKDRDSWDQRWEDSYVQLNGRSQEQRLSSSLPPLDELKNSPLELEKIRRQWVLGKIADEELVRLGPEFIDEDFQAYVSNAYFEEIRDTELFWAWLKEYYEDESIQKPKHRFPQYEYDQLVSLYENRESPAKFHNILFGELEEEVKEEEIEKTFERDTKEKLGRTALKSWNIDLESLNSRITGEYVPTLTKGLASGGVFLFQFTVQFALSLLLSFFITFDLSRMKKGIRALAHSRASNFYREISPSLAAFGALIGRAFQAQGIIAICNTVLTFALIKGLNIPFETFLCTIVFFCSFIPVLGVVISTVPIALIALMYNGWSDAILSVIGVLLIHFVETSILNPKILGEMLHLHPVMVLCILAVGEHFFKVWGLLLGVPVMVYVIRYVIMGEDIASITRSPTPWKAKRGGKGARQSGDPPGDDGPGEESHDLVLPDSATVSGS